jgi:hypothetical protein
MTCLGEAVIDLLGPDEGGLREAVPSGTRSFLIRFDDPTADETLGVFLEAPGEDHMLPGSSVAVRLTFWSDTARIYGSEGATFSVWYGRLVGRGRITRAVE